MKSRHAGALALTALLSLTACSDINEFLGNDDSVDYKSARRGDPLSIPPDLTQAASDPRYRAPETGATTFSEYQQQGQAAQQAASVGQPSVLPQRNDMRVERDGQLRWLSIDRPPEEVFPKLVDFWNEQGFNVVVNNPQAGLIQTDWAENRAKIPEGWIRQALGKIIDFAFDSGERERFRTRVERVDGNRTEVFVSHEQMIEKRSDSTDLVSWTPGKEDPGLNAAMLARMLVYLGTDVDRARTLVAQAEESRQRPAVQQVDRATGAELHVNEPFDRAWRRVGVALDSGGFTVDDRDRAAGDFYVRYLDTDTGEKREQPNLLSRMFGGRNMTQPEQFRVHLAEQGGSTVVTVLDAEGNRTTNATAQRLLNVLADKL
jgi:Uncharacterized lipoprotein